MKLLMFFILFGCGSKPMKNCKPVVDIPENHKVESLQDIKFTDYSQCKSLWWWE